MLLFDLMFIFGSIIYITQMLASKTLTRYSLNFETKTWQGFCYLLGYWKMHNKKFKFRYIEFCSVKKPKMAGINCRYYKDYHYFGNITV